MRLRERRFKRFWKPEYLFDEFIIILALVALAFHSLSPASSSVADTILIVVSLIGIVPVLHGGVASLLLDRKLTIDLLAAAALGGSLVQGEFVSAAFIGLMLASARLFETITEARASRAIERLLALRPETARIRRGDKIVVVPLHEVKVGDLLLVEAGDRVPVDGVAEEGAASLNEATLTGEAAPVEKKKGDKLWSGTESVAGTITIRAEKIGKDTTVEKMAALVAQAGEEKPITQRIADRFAAIYIAAVFVAVVVIYIGTGSTLLVLSLLLVTCADDIAVAVPLGFALAVATGAKRGMLIKRTAVFETLGKVRIVALDKTGTLTRGRPKVAALETYDGGTQDTLERGLALLTATSSHPSSVAIREGLAMRHVAVHIPDRSEEVPGQGMRASRGDEHFLSGKLAFLRTSGVTVGKDVEERVLVLEKEGASVTTVARGHEVVGFAVLEDELRPRVKEAMAQLRVLGVEHIVMLTGDNELAAKRVAAAVGITEVVANCTPESKLKELKKLKKKYKQPLAYVGDGVNDAAALALADVSFAMGAIGSDAAIEAADIALMHDDISRLPEAIELGIECMRVVRQNFWIWGITNGAGLLMVVLGMIGPAGAAFYNFATDFLPIGNVFQLLKIRKEKPPTPSFRT